MTPAERDEKNYGEIDVILLYIEDARARTERAAAELTQSTSYKDS